jgi:hypothetical protein
LLSRQELFVEYETVNAALPPVPVPRSSDPIRRMLVPPRILTVQLKPVPVLLLVERELEGMAKEVPPGIAPKNLTVLRGGAGCDKQEKTTLD